MSWKDHPSGKSRLAIDNLFYNQFSLMIGRNLGIKKFFCPDEFGKLFPELVRKQFFENKS